MAKESFIIFSQNAEGEFKFKVREVDNIQALGAEVVFTITDDQGKPSTAVTIDAVSLPVGTYASNKWTIGSMRNVVYEPTFKVVVQNNTAQFVKVTATINSSIAERDVSNNLDIIEFIGPSFAEVTEHISEKIIAIPDTAFANANTPLLSEVETWVANTLNVSVSDSLNGTMIEYNPNPYTETDIGGDIQYSGTREPAYIWRLNNDSGSIKVSEVRKKGQSGVWYVSPTGDKERVLEGNPEFAATSLQDLLEFNHLSNGDNIHFLTGDYIFDNSVLNLPSYQGLKITDINDITFIFDPNCSIDASSFGAIFKATNESDEALPNSKIKVLGYPSITGQITNEMFENTHPESETVIEFDKVDNSRLIFAFGRRNIVKINELDLVSVGGTGLKFTGVGGNQAGYIKSDGETAVLFDNSIFDIYVKRVISSISDTSLGVSNFRPFDSPVNVKNIFYRFKSDNVIYTNRGTSYHTLVEFNDRSATNPDGYFEDSYFDVSFGSVIDDSTQVVKTNPYVYSSDGGLIISSLSLLNSTMLIHDTVYRGGAHFFKTNSFPSSGDTFDIDGSKIIFRNLDIETSNSLFDILLDNATGSFVNNSEIIFENCRLVSTGTYTGSIDLKPESANNDNTSVVTFKNCYLETKDPGESILYFRGDTLKLINCTLVNDGTAEDITSDAGIGTIDLISINTYSNSTTATNTAFSLVAGDGINRDAQII